MRTPSETGARSGSTCPTSTRASELHGTGGALRFALDRARSPEVFGVLYGDSYLPIELAPIWAAFDAAGRPALMTVHRNEDRWDRSNAVLEAGSSSSYDKRPEARDARMAWIDYGFSVLRRERRRGHPCRGGRRSRGRVSRPELVAGELGGLRGLRAVLRGRIARQASPTSSAISRGR